jgi:hypothetical protein
VNINDMETGCPEMSWSFHLITWLPVSMSLSLSPNYRLHRRWRFNEEAL